MIRLCLPYANGIDVTQTPAHKSAMKLRGDFELATKQGFDVAQNRDQCITQTHAMRQTNFKFPHALCLDPDVAFTQDDIEMLLSRDKDVISGAYNHKDIEGAIHAGFWGDRVGIVERYILQTQTGQHPCHWTGGGFLLIKSSVFARMTYPWFDCGFPVLYYENGIQCVQTCKEAHAFCARLPEVWIDCDCKVKHCEI